MSATMGESDGAVPMSTFNSKWEAGEGAMNRPRDSRRVHIPPTSSLFAADGISSMANQPRVTLSKNLVKNKCL
jgi:hypothetical protein